MTRTDEIKTESGRNPAFQDLTSWLDEIDRDLADLTARVRLQNAGVVRRSAETDALGQAMSRVSDTISELLEALPVDTDGTEESRSLCMGLIYQWLDFAGRHDESGTRG